MVIKTFQPARVLLTRIRNCHHCGAPARAFTMQHPRWRAGHTRTDYQHLGYCPLRTIGYTPRDEFDFSWGNPQRFERVDDSGGVE